MRKTIFMLEEFFRSFRKSVFKNLLLMLMFSISLVMAVIMCSYYLVSGIGFVVGLLVGLGLSYVMPDIHIIMRDVLLAFAMTIGLGTVILFICYYLNRRHV